VLSGRSKRGRDPTKFSLAIGLSYKETQVQVIALEKPTRQSLGIEQLRLSN